MKVSFYCFAILLLSFNLSCKNSQNLFQENTKDWNVEGDADWSFSNNQLIGKIDKGSGFVLTKQTYEDFLLEMEFKPDSTINSGVFIRCKDSEINPMNCYEANIWDLHPNQDYRTGAIVLKSKPLAIVETIGKWNSYRIKSEKDHLLVWINGVLMADIRDKAHPLGHIALQATGSGEVRFRNVRIQPIEAD